MTDDLLNNKILIVHNIMSPYHVLKEMKQIIKSYSITSQQNALSHKS